VDPETIYPDLLDALATARTIHRYRSDPVPEEDLGKILYAATRAPSGSNAQPFRFLVLRDGEETQPARSLLGDSFRSNWSRKSSDEGWRKGSGTDPESPKARTARVMQRFVDEFERIPVIVLACYQRHESPGFYDGSSIYPACQNLLLAARALGYGACFSVWHLGAEKPLKELLGIPEPVSIALTITLGRPEGRHGPLRRRPVADLVYEGHWERPAAWVHDPPGSRFSRSGPPSRARAGNRRSS
jgi:nitroreductase